MTDCIMACFCRASIFFSFAFSFAVLVPTVFSFSISSASQSAGPLSSYVLYPDAVTDWRLWGLDSAVKAQTEAGAVLATVYDIMKIP